MVKKERKSEENLELHQFEAYYSIALDNYRQVEVYLPKGYFSTRRKYPLLLLNDGQDVKALKLVETLIERNAKEAPSIIVVAVSAVDRMQEYGTATQADYLGRGSASAAYQQFLMKELLPDLHRRYRIKKGKRHHAIAGFSLGGLSAMDTAWNHPDYFGRVGVFSGSFWWRSKAFDPTDPDADRIMHRLIANGKRPRKQRFWLQTGTRDETADRNNNGIIDAIDDTLDLILALRQIGVKRKQYKYVEVVDGEHNFDTWSAVFPDFLNWAFGK